MVQDHISQISYGTWAFASSESGSKPPCGNRRRVTPNATCLGTSTLPQQNNPFFLGHFTYLYIIYVFGTSSTAIIASFGITISGNFRAFFRIFHFWCERYFSHRQATQAGIETINDLSKSLRKWQMPIQTGSKTHPFGHEICHFFFCDALNATKSY